jgi:hypothetical protein
MIIFRLLYPGFFSIDDLGKITRPLLPAGIAGANLRVPGFFDSIGIRRIVEFGGRYKYGTMRHLRGGSGVHRVGDTEELGAGIL